jgi:hypothetical protein
MIPPRIRTVNPAPKPLKLVIDNHLNASYTIISFMADERAAEEGNSPSSRYLYTMTRKENSARSNQTSGSIYSQDSFDSSIHSTIITCLFSNVPLSSAEGSLTPPLIVTNSTSSSPSPAHEARMRKIGMNRDDAIQKERERRLGGIEAGKRSNKRASLPQDSQFTTQPSSWESDEETQHPSLSLLQTHFPATTTWESLDFSSLPLSAYSNSPTLLSANPAHARLRVKGTRDGLIFSATSSPRK